MTTKSDGIELIIHKINTDRAWEVKALASLIYDANKGSKHFLNAVNKWKAKPPSNPPVSKPSTTPEIKGSNDWNDIG